MNPANIVGTLKEFDGTGVSWADLAIASVDLAAR